MTADLTIPFDAALFDLDGTLVDSFEAIRASTNFVRARHGLSPLDLATVSMHVGNGLQHLLESTVGIGEMAENSRVYLQHHPSVIGPMTRLLPGVRATLDALHERGIQLGICSNKPLPLTTRLLDELQIAHLFEVVLGPESVPRRKPAPDMLLRAIELLSMSKERVIYVGDMVVDIETGRAAGVRCWAIPTGIQSSSELAVAGPDRLLSEFADIGQPMSG